MHWIAPAVSPAQVGESLRGRRVVWSFGLEAREREKFSESLHRLTKNLIRLDLQEARTKPLLETLGLLAGILCSILGATRVLKGELSPETFLTFYVGLVMLLDPLRKLADTHLRVQRGIAAASRLLEILRDTPEQPPIGGNTPLTALTEGFRVEHLTVKSPQGSRILHDLSFRAEPGEVVWIAGRSGAGKSTLLDVLGGLRRYDSGAVRLNATVLEEFAAADFRQRVALVAQETFLFRGSIRDNITLDQKPAGISLEQAVSAAGLVELLDQLPQGLETRIDEHQLSVGERQRISLARALYRDPLVLLLDEATSALDRPRGEQILDAVLKLKETRITFLVSHQMTTQIKVDRVVLLDQGSIIDCGSYEQLFARSSLIRQLLNGVDAKAQA